MSEARIRCVVVGDGTVGKTRLLIRYLLNDYPTDYIPTVFDNFAVTILVGEENYELHLVDTAGQNEYSRHVHKLAYIDADVFLVCFSVDLLSSYRNVPEMWIPDLQHLCPDVPFLLIGTKIDLRYSQDTIRKLSAEGTTPLTTAQGEKLAKELNAAKYMKCSALTTENVAAIFQEAVNIAIRSRKVKDEQNKSDPKCCICAKKMCVIM